MTKKIPVERLKPGMYIADLNSEWMAHPFLRNHFLVKEEETIQKLIRAGIREVYIDPQRGLDVNDAPSAEEVQRATETAIVQVGEEAAMLPRIPIREERDYAAQLYLEGVHLIREMMQDVRLGRQVAVHRVDPLVRRIAESTIRNPDALLSLVRVKNKDLYTFQHSVAVGALVVAFSHTVGLDVRQVHLAGVGGLLHDIGKVSIPDHILNKPGRLTEEEFAVMRCHVAEGKKILEAAHGIHDLSIQAAYQHHERCDGSGYPEALSAATISDAGKMVAICDVYDAITSDRVYHKALLPHQAVRKLFEWANFHFDPDRVQDFIRMIGIYPIGTLVLLQSGRIGIVTEQRSTSLLQPRLTVFYDTRWGHYISPVDVDLSRPMGRGGADEIVGPTTSEQWGITRYPVAPPTPQETIPYRLD
ncbi:HD-GYP domain-containing protein [Sulfobacillus harzensis]|uniref:HD-GYP domain-containing protein n=1 Tax=Sulfobacillus harzensis TaxID=2729629 RepID=A0A7Y0L6C6_9FIRM|nr:HD-GYP domain-containing protein [Sulfobacillus harzensis]NMP23265.1 HD-GYP domain-containing protein [Sulfobacillus harzensis]